MAMLRMKIRPSRDVPEHATIKIDEAVGNKRASRASRSESVVENDAEFALNFAGVQNAVAQDAADDRKRRSKSSRSSDTRASWRCRRSTRSP